MKKLELSRLLWLWAVLLAGAFLVSVPAAQALDHCDGSDGQGCCDCTFPIVGTCIKHKGTNTNCKCTCDMANMFCASGGGPCNNNACAEAPVRNTPATMARMPWTNSPKLTIELAASSTLPTPYLFYDLVLTDELRAGPAGHHGGLSDPAHKSNYVIWYNLEDNIIPGQAQLTVWVDTEGIWKQGSDTHMSPVRLPITETVSFYEDHWSQTNAKGTFSGKVEPFSAPGQPAHARTTPEVLAHIPWTTQSGLAVKLAQHSTMPTAGLLYLLALNSELKEGPIGHGGNLWDGTKQSPYLIWWDLDDNPNTHESKLRVWLDKEGNVGPFIQDVEAKLPVAETVTFYEDHWEQTTAKGKFSGNVDPFPVNQAKVNPPAHQ
ncbi:MAG: hypothetical protein ACRD2S_07520 [Terriglobales bacterium]